MYVEGITKAAPLKRSVESGTCEWISGCVSCDVSGSTGGMHLSIPSHSRRVTRWELVTIGRALRVCNIWTKHRSMFTNRLYRHMIAMIYPQTCGHDRYLWPMEISTVLYNVGIITLTMIMTMVLVPTAIVSENITR